MLYDLIIIGGGPASVAAGVYAARKRVKTLVLTYDFDGQSIVSADIQNWIGTTSISGEQLAANLKAHLTSYRSADFVINEGVKVTKVEQSGKNFVVTTDKGEKFESRSVFVGTGAERRKLTVPGAAEYEHKGITYCATCDGPLYADQDVVVIGGGNAAFETAVQLLAYCKSVTLINRSESFRADEITVEKTRQNPKMRIITNAELVSFSGNKFVESLRYRDTQTNEEKTLVTQGVFVEIGLLPTTWFLKDLVTLNQIGQVVVDPRTQSSSTPGLWAAGDCTDGLYHQNNIAAGDAVKALEDIYQYLHRTS